MTIPTDAKSLKIHVGKMKGGRKKKIVSKIAKPDRAVMRRVLIVDDHEDAATYMSLLIRQQGNDTRVALSGAEAVTIAGKYLPHFVLIDINMPDMDGYETVHKLRQVPSLINSCLVAITANSSDAVYTRILTVGFDKFFAKPVDIELLQSFLRSRMISG
ncbi:MAG: response regulator [Chthoniobacterales bacterium]